ncbi:MAG: hypothetical protein Q6K14_10710 [Gloeomargarita sp. GMQP_bins_44]
MQETRCRDDDLQQREEKVIPEEIREEAKTSDGAKVFWWFWRCFPKALCQKFGDESLKPVCRMGPSGAMPASRQR